MSLPWNIERGSDKGNKFRYLSSRELRLFVSLEAVLIGGGGSVEESALMASKRSCQRARLTPHESA
jgi:hypothetical protein